MQTVNNFNALEYLRRLARESERQNLDAIGKRIEAQAVRRQKIDAMRQRLDAIIYKPEINGLV